MAARTLHNDEKLLEMYDTYGIEKADHDKKHELWIALTEQYNKFIGENFTPLQVRRRKYAIDYQPRKNEIRRQKALKQRIAFRNDQQQQSTTNLQSSLPSNSKAKVRTKAELKQYPNEDLSHYAVQE